METSTRKGRFRDGKLTRKMEMFSWQENVDLEGICDIYNGLLLCLLFQTFVHRPPFSRTAHRPT
ncbi:hypothetical protein F4815DRAFT_467860, partial [Daldinia loculata]